MMDAKRAAAAWNAIAAEDESLPPMTCCGLESDTEEFADPEAAWTALESLSPCEGWVLFQSRQRWFGDGLPRREEEWGFPLAAEAAVSENESVRLDHAGGRWRLTRFTHRPEGALLCDEVGQYLHGGGGRLRYRRYWRLDGEQGCVQQQACLIGIEREEEEG